MRSSSPFCLVAFAAFFLAVSHAFIAPAPLRLSSSLCQRRPARIIVSMADGEGETKPKGKGWVRVGEWDEGGKGVRMRLPLLVIRPMCQRTVRRLKRSHSPSPPSTTWQLLHVGPWSSPSPGTVSFRLPASTHKLPSPSSPKPFTHLPPLSTFSPYLLLLFQNHSPLPLLPPYSPPNHTAGRPRPPHLFLFQWAPSLHRPPQQEGRRRRCCCCCLGRPCPTWRGPPLGARRRVSDRCYGWGWPSCGQFAFGERPAGPRLGT